MHRCLSKALLSLAVLSVGLASAADPPPSGLKVLGPALTQPPESAALVVPAGRFVPFAPRSGEPVYLPASRAYRVYKLAPGSVYVGVKYDAAADAEPESWTAPADVKGPVYVVLARGYVGTYSLQPIKNGPTDTGPVEDGGPLTIQIVQGPRPPPTPVDPVVPPVDPVVPPVVKSFHVIFVTESAATLTAQQQAVCGAKAVRDYLASKTTPEAGVAGWRNYDPQTTAQFEPQAFKDIWAAVKGKLATVPCLVVQVNEKIEIVPFPANAADALKTLQTYGGK